MATQREKRGSNPIPEGLNTGGIGAASEMLVCADLVLRGLSVLRAVSPSCPFDLAVMKSGKLLRVEVTTGRRHPTGKVIHVKKDKERFDILAVVIKKEIIYIPDL